MYIVTYFAFGLDFLRQRINCSFEILGFIRCTFLDTFVLLTYIMTHIQKYLFNYWYVVCNNSNQYRYSKVSCVKYLSFDPRLGQTFG